MLSNPIGSSRIELKTGEVKGGRDEGGKDVCHWLEHAVLDSHAAVPIGNRGNTQPGVKGTP